MKEMLKNKGIISFIVFSLVVVFIYSLELKKDCSSDTTNSLKINEFSNTNSL